jgi:hypothetical protein
VTDPVRPPAAVQDRREGDRRRGLRRAKAEGDGRDLVPITPVEDQTPPRATPRADAGPSTFDAQMLGQDGAKRGLRGGQEVLGKARSTYLSSEYAGSGDRRPKPGQVKKTEI